MSAAIAPRPSDAILARLMTLHPKIIDLTLDRIQRLLDTLGNPERRLPPVVHISGTNGKGSTLAMIRAGLEGQGLSVHAYTSPHLVRFHERIRLSGALIDEQSLSAILDECAAANAGAPITYFEITTAAAILAMARTPADFTLLEVGLGGLFDATNVIDTPALSVITPISADHQQYLGDSLAEIAVSKAGIVKAGVPAVVGPQPDDALTVIERRAARLSAPLQVHGQHWQVAREFGRLVFQDETGLMDLPLPALTGAHQLTNAGMAVAALRSLGHADGADAAMRNVRWPARLQRLTAGRLPALAPGAEIWLDGGHNPAAGDSLAHTMAGLPARPLHLVCGMLNTKDIAGYLRPLAGVAVSLAAVSIPGETATLSAADTAAAATAAGLNASAAPTVAAALAGIAAHSPGARILICGSLYLAGHVLHVNGQGGPT